MHRRPVSTQSPPKVRKSSAMDTNACSSRMSKLYETVLKCSVESRCLESVSRSICAVDNANISQSRLPLTNNPPSISPRPLCSCYIKSRELIQEVQKIPGVFPRVQDAAGGKFPPGSQSRIPPSPGTNEASSGYVLFLIVLLKSAISCLRVKECDGGQP